MSRGSTSAGSPILSPTYTTASVGAVNTSPKRIVDIAPMGKMLAGHQRRMSHAYSRLGPPKQKGKA